MLAPAPEADGRIGLGCPHCGIPGQVSILTLIVSSYSICSCWLLFVFPPRLELRFNLQEVTLHFWQDQEVFSVLVENVLSLNKENKCRHHIYNWYVTMYYIIVILMLQPALPLRITFSSPGLGPKSAFEG